MNELEKLVDAAFNGNKYLMVKLMDKVFDINATSKSWNALHAAIENEKVECVQLLVDFGADLEIENLGLTPLAHAVDISIDGNIQNNGELGEEHTEIIDILLRSGANPNSGLALARKYGSKKIIEKLDKAN